MASQQVTIPMIEINGVAHTILTVGRWDECRAFYAKLLPFHYAGIEAVRRSSGLPLLPVVLNTKHPARTLKDYYHLVGATITVKILEPIPFDEVQRDPRAVYQALEETIRRTVREIRAEEELSESSAANARTES